jgi:protoporphyrinogen oxidase
VRVETLVAGGGLSGLACARELAGASHPYLLVEREKEPGGLCRTVRSQGFTFDYTGHFLHFKDPVLRERVMALTGGLLKERARHAAIHSEGSYSEYPYQENNAGLSSGSVRENVLGILEAELLRRRTAVPSGPPAHFRDWCLRSFGPGISKRFMFPYNQKLWKFPLDKLTTHWMGRFVPKPDLGRVLAGALRKAASGSGYNATFLYPDHGGISILPRALAAGLPNLWRGIGLRHLDLDRRKALLTSGLEVGFRSLVSSLPLPALASLTKGLPGRLRKAVGALKATSIYNINLGLGRRHPIPYSWVYFPGKEFLFHRAGSVSACVPTVAPKGRSSLYVEFSYRGARPDPVQLGRHALRKLKDLGWIGSDRDVETRVDLDLPGAYVVYDEDRDGAVGDLLAFFQGKGVSSIGRYGRWEYGSMESAIAQGLAAAKGILSKAG